MRQHPWGYAGLMWPSGVILVLLTWFLLARASGRPVEWPAAIGVALICPAIASVGLALGMREQAEYFGKSDAGRQDEG
jgi:hypothetical protein